MTHRLHLAVLFALFAAPPVAPQEGPVIHLDLPSVGTKPGLVLVIGRVEGTPPFALEVQDQAVPVEIQPETNLWQVSVSLEPGNHLLRMKLTDGTGAVVTKSADVLSLRGWTFGEDRPIHHVSDADELVAALGPERIVVLRPGDYHLDRTTAESVHLSRKEGSGNAALQDLEDLLLVGTAGERTRIVTERRGGTALTLERCTGVRLIGLELDHATPTGALSEDVGDAGGALNVRFSEQVWVQDCDLRGVGVGLRATKAVGLVVDHGAIQDCTQGIATLKNSSQVEFFDARLLRNGSGRTGDFGLLVEGADRGTLRFVRCELRQNRPGPEVGLFTIDGKGRRVLFSKGVIEDNLAKHLRGGEAGDELDVADSRVQSFP